MTIRQLWQHCLEDGWWPPVVSGTMHVTLGGGLATNIHGKNNFRVGPLGDHVTEFDLLLPGSAEVKTCRRDTEPELFHAVIGGLGLLGIVTRIALQMKRVYSGLLRVDAFATKNLSELFEQFEARRHEADYLVGWIDCFASGEALGRGLVHQANYLRPGEDREPAQTLRVANQELPDTLFGIMPKSAMGRLLQPFTNNVGMGMINFAKFVQGSTLGHNQTVLQPHAQFAFLLDYVPNWKYAYKPGAMTQFQSFVPAEHAEAVFRQLLALSQKSAHRAVPWSVQAASPRRVPADARRGRLFSGVGLPAQQQQRSRTARAGGADGTDRGGAWRAILFRQRQLAESPPDAASS